VPFLTGKPVDKDDVAEKCVGLETALDQMENYFLKERAYLAGDEISIADLLGICELMQPGCVGFEFTKGRPNLQRWFEKVKAEVQPYYDVTHKDIMEFGQKYQM